MPPKKYDYEEIVSLYKKLGNGSEVARRLGIQYDSTVHRVLKKYGLASGRPGSGYQHFGVDMKEAVRLYRSGWRMKDVAEKYNLPTEALRRRFEVLGEPRRKRGPEGYLNFQWKGGKSKERKNMHFHRRRAYEVAAICLGQPTPQGTIIHHVDENNENNNPENLILFPNQGKHAGYHQRLLKCQRLSVEVDPIQLALENGGQVLPPPPNPIVFAPDKGHLFPLGKRKSPRKSRTQNGQDPPTTPQQESD